MRSDFELLEAWRADDRAAASELFARHFADVYRFFRDKVEGCAEDLTQQTFLSCLKARDEFRNASSFRTYLFSVARNHLYMHFRRRARGGTAVDFEITSLADLDLSASGTLALREEHKLLVHALRRLPLALQVAIELYYVQRLRGQELVEVLGVAPGTVRSRIRRGLEQLRANMSMLASSPQRIRTTITDLTRWAAEVRDAGAPAKPGG